MFKKGKLLHLSINLKKFFKINYLYIFIFKIIFISIYNEDIKSNLLNLNYTVKFYKIYIKIIFNFCIILLLNYLITFFKKENFINIAVKLPLCLIKNFIKKELIYKNQHKVSIFLTKLCINYKVSHYSILLDCDFFKIKDIKIYIDKLNLILFFYKKLFKKIIFLFIIKNKNYLINLISSINIFIKYQENTKKLNNIFFKFFTLGLEGLLYSFYNINWSIF